MLQNSEIPISCGNCGKVTKKRVSWFRSNKSLICACGTRITVDATQFNREMRKVEKSLDDLKRAFKNFGR